MRDFNEMGLPKLLLARVGELGLSEPTPIQAEAVPHAMAGRDVMGLAQTGTGKTYAFGLPLASVMLRDGVRPSKRAVRGLVLAPTRELAKQISESLRELVKGSPLKVGLVVGGAGINGQINRLERGTDLLVATPGRLIDLLDRKAVRLDETKFLVLDEADQMLDMGFIHALRRIAPKLGTPRQTMLFSATMPKQMEELSSAYLTNPRRVQVAPPGKAADKVTQSIHFMEKPAKPAKLREILSRDPEALTLVFARTKHGAEKLMKGLVADGFNAASIHGNKSQGQRDRAIKAFRDGQIKTLVATDVAARGIDIPGVAYVINFDLPDVPDNYVHRIGRTARAGLEGEAITLCSAEEIDLLKQVEKVMKLEIPVAGGTRPAAVKSDKPRRGGGGQRRRGPGGGNGQAGKPQGNTGSRKPRRPRRHAA